MGRIEYFYPPSSVLTFSVTHFTQIVQQDGVDIERSAVANRTPYSRINKQKGISR